MRQFRLINGNGETFDLMRKDAFFHAPGGLGFDRDIESMMAGYEFVELRDDLAQKVITGEMVFLGYEQYKEFVSFIGSRPLRLEYKPLNQWHRIRVKVQRLGKTEISRVGRLICAIDFLAFSTWYNVLNYETVPEVEPEDENLMIRGNAFYSESDSSTPPNEWTIGASTDADDVVKRFLSGNTAPSMNTVPVQLPGFTGDTYQLAAGDYYFKAIGKRQGVRSYFKVKPLTKTASGNPIQISDAIEVAPNSLEVSVSLKQDGTPWIGSETNTDPYTFRSMPSIAAGGNREYDKLIGASVAWNQLVQNGNFNGTTNWTQNASASISASNNVLTLTTNTTSNSHRIYQSLSAKSGHSYFVTATLTASEQLSVFVGFGTGSNTATAGISTIIAGNTRTVLQSIVTPSVNTAYVLARIYQEADAGKTLNVENFMVLDLTQMFGATVANAITADLFRKYFPDLYYAYDAGSIQSVSVSEKVTTGKNLFDEDTAYSSFKTGTNAFTGTAGGVFAIKNYIPSGLVGKEITASVKYTAIASTSAYVQANVNGTNKNGNSRSSGNLGVSSVTFTPTSTSDFFCLTFGSGSSQNISFCDVQVEIGSATTYEAYAANTYTLDDTELRGLFSIVDGELTADGDEYPSRGNGTQKYGHEVLADLTWYPATNNRFYTPLPNGIADGTDRTDFLIVGFNPQASFVDGNAWIYNGWLYVVDSTHPDVTSFVSSLGSKDIVYPLNTPTTLSLTPYTNPQIVDPDGTESYTDAGVDAGTRDVAIPVGHKSNYALSVPVIGMDEVSVTVSGRNLIPYPYFATSGTVSNGVTYTYGADGLINLSGTASSTSLFYLLASNKRIRLNAGTYTMSVNQANNLQVRIYFIDGTYKRIVADDTSITFTLDETDYVYIRIQVSTGQTVDVQGLSIQLEHGSTATAYVPYDSNSATYTHSLSPTMYGGQVEMVSGVETSTMAEVDLGSLSWTYNNGWNCWFTNGLTDVEVVDNNTPVNGLAENFNIIKASGYTSSHPVGSLAINIAKNMFADTGDKETSPTGKFIYQLATPTSNQGAVSAVELLKGENVISTDGDDIDLNYDAYPDSRLVLDVYGELAPDPDSAADTQVVANFTVYADQEVQFYMDQEDIPFDFSIEAFLAAGSYPAKKIYGYPYPYSYADSINGEMDVFNGSTVAGYCLLTIHGPVEDPIWAVYQNGQLLQRGKITATIPEGHTLVVDSSPTELEISERTLDGELVANRYADSDFSTVRFITIPPGSSKVVITQTGDEPITAYLEVDELEATV